MGFSNIKCLLAASFLVLSGCKGLAGPEAGPEAEPNRQLISELHFKSAHLKQCVAQAAALGRITFVDQLEVLRCSSVGHGLFAAFFTAEESDSIVNSEGLLQLSALKELDLSDNWLSHTDFSKLPNLTKLKLSGNVYQSLDLSKNHELTELDISCNPIAKLILPNNSKLEALTAVGGYCDSFGLLDGDDRDASPLVDVLKDSAGLPLTRESFDHPLAFWLDLSTQVALRSVNISLSHSNTQFYLNLPSDNQLKSLVLSDNSLEDIDLHNLIKLETLRLTGNTITALDLSALSELRVLISDNNQLISIKFPDTNSITLVSLTKDDLDNSILEDLSAFSHLTDLDIYGFSQLPSSPILRSVSLYSEESVDVAAFPVLSELQTLRIQSPSVLGLNAIKAPKLEQLEINARFSTMDVQLPQLTQLKALSFSSEVRSLTTGSSGTLQSLLMHYSGEVLDLSGYKQLNSLVVLGAQKLLPAGLLVPPTLTYLSLDSVPWTLNEMDGLSGLTTLSLTNCHSLQALDLYGMPNLQNLGLNGLPALQHLDLSPLAGMTGSLNIMNTGLLDIEAVGLEDVANVFIIGNPDLDDASRDTIQVLTGVPVYN